MKIKSNNYSDKQIVKEKSKAFTLIIYSSFILKLIINKIIIKIVTNKEF